MMDHRFLSIESCFINDRIVVSKTISKGEPMSRVITIYDIAKAVGASPATVSKALNGRRDVSDAMRDKIIKKAAEMGYRPNVNARGLKMKKSWLVGIVYGSDMHDTLEHPLFLPIMDAFKRQMEMHGYELLFLSQSSKFIGDSLFSHAFSRQVEGLLLINVSPETANLFKHSATHIPMVSCDGIISSMTSVLTDNESAGIEAVDYLYKMGHRSIGHIAGPVGMIATAGEERKRGFKLGLERCGLVYDESQVVTAKGWTFKAGRDAFMQLLNQNPHMTAVFCAADFYLMGVLDVCKERNLTIPQDMSVIGFDDLQWTAYMNPGFTTFRQDKEMLGKLSADRLVENINGEHRKEIIRIPATLVIRDSVTHIV
jgi:LacI family transcriptional regulator